MKIKLIKYALVFCLMFIVKTSFSQLRVKTDVLKYFFNGFPVDGETFRHYGVELGVGLDSSAQRNYLELAVSDTKQKRIRRNDYAYERSTFTMRGKLTSYSNKSIKRKGTGFYKGVYFDFTRFKEKSFTYYDLSENVEFREGWLPSIGFHLGYTFIVKNVIIEPTMGISLGFLPDSLREEPDGLIDFSGLTNTLMMLSASYLNLNIGYAF